MHCSWLKSCVSLIKQFRSSHQTVVNNGKLLLNNLATNLDTPLSPHHWGDYLCNDDESHDEHKRSQTDQHSTPKCFSHYVGHHHAVSHRWWNYSAHAHIKVHPIDRRRGAPQYYPIMHLSICINKREEELPISHHASIKVHHWERRKSSQYPIMHLSRCSSLREERAPNIPSCIYQGAAHWQGGRMKLLDILSCIYQGTSLRGRKELLISHHASIKVHHWERGKSSQYPIMHLSRCSSLRGREDEAPWYPIMHLSRCSSLTGREDEAPWYPIMHLREDPK